MSRRREKECTDDYRALSMTRLKRDGCLTIGHRFEWSWSRWGKTLASINIEVESRCALRLSYTSSSRGSEPQQHNYVVSLDWTPCHLGGERPWFRCPDCDRRVLKLYGSARFVCRRCLRLNYPSQQADKRYRPIERAWQLRQKLGCDLGPLDVPAEWIKRPKGMHRRTFARHLERLTEVEGQVDAVMEALEQRLGRKAV